MATLVVAGVVGGLAPAGLLRATPGPGWPPRRCGRPDRRRVCSPGSAGRAARSSRSAVAIVFAVVLIFGVAVPGRACPTSTGDELPHASRNASSSPYTLGVMTWVAVILTPIVLAYQAWTYWVFRKRITVEQIPEHAGLPARPRCEAARPAPAPQGPVSPPVRPAHRGARRADGRCGGRPGAAPRPRAVPCGAAHRRLAGRRAAGRLARRWSWRARALLTAVQERFAHRCGHPCDGGAARAGARARRRAGPAVDRRATPAWPRSPPAGLDALEPYFVRYLPQLLLAATVTPATLAVVLAHDVIAAITIAVTLPLIPLFMVLIGRMTQGYADRRLAAMTRLGHQVLDLLAGSAHAAGPRPRARPRAPGRRARRRAPPRHDGHPAGRVPVRA